MKEENKLIKLKKKLKKFATTTERIFFNYGEWGELQKFIYINGLYYILFI